MQARVNKICKYCNHAVGCDWLLSEHEGSLYVHAVHHAPAAKSYCNVVLSVLHKS